MTDKLTMKKLSLFLIVLSTTAIAQIKRPMEEIFYLESSLSHAKTNLASNEAWVKSFDERHGALNAQYKIHQKNVKGIEALTARIKSIPEKRRTKQEKAFFTMSRCIHELFNNERENVNSVSHCAYVTNVDPLLFKQTSKGKILGESGEIQNMGDDISKMIDRLSNEVPSKEKFAEFKRLEGSSAHKEYLEKESFVRSNAEIKQIELAIAERKALDKLVNEELMDCKKEIALPELDYQKMTQDGSAELTKDLLEAVTQQNDISTSSYLGTVGLSPCKAFNELRFKGYCLEKKKKSREISGDCESCHAKMGKMQGEELAAHLAAIVQNEKEDCKGKGSVATKMGFIHCDVGVTNNVRFEKDKAKQVLRLRKLVATNIAQGIPVGKKQNDIYGSIVGIKNDAGVCKYQVRDLSNGKSRWVPETSILEGLQELNQILRR